MEGELKMKGNKADIFIFDLFLQKYQSKIIICVLLYTLKNFTQRPQRETQR